MSDATTLQPLPASPAPPPVPARVLIEVHLREGLTAQELLALADVAQARGVSVEMLIVQSARQLAAERGAA